MRQSIIAVLFLLGFVIPGRSQDSSEAKIPFDGIETNWQNGADRQGFIRLSREIFYSFRFNGRKLYALL